jgi:hypothetical protein
VTAIGSPNSPAVTTSTSDTAHHFKNVSGCSVRLKEMSDSERRWSVHCAIEPNYRRVFDSFDPVPNGTSTLCPPRYAVLTDSSLVPGGGSSCTTVLCISQWSVIRLSSSS